MKTKYSRKIRDDWSNKFKVDKQALDIASSDRPSWMNMDKDKKLITAIIKSHHQYIKVLQQSPIFFAAVGTISSFFDFDRSAMNKSKGVWSAVAAALACVA